MPELDNAKRSLERATYTPIARPARRPPREGRSWDKWSYVAGLRATAREAATVARRLTSGSNALRGRNATQMREIARLAVVDADAPEASTALQRAREFEDIPADLLLTFGKELADLRDEEVDRSIDAAHELGAAYAKQPAPRAEPARAPEPPPGLKLDRAAVVAALPGARIFRVQERKRLPAAARPRASDGTSPPPETKGLMMREEVVAIRPAPQGPTTGLAAPSELAVGPLLEWGLRHKQQVAHVSESLALVQVLGVEMMNVREYSIAAKARVAATKDLNHFFSERLRVEPVGLLHLERVSFIPAGIERGELTHSVPLSPAEEVNISHKEWSNTSEEFERIVTDFIEAYSEEGVTEKRELTQSMSSQVQHSSSFNLGVTASGGYGPVSISTTVGFNVSDSSNNSQQVARNQTNELTRKASSRTKKEHKMSFKVASASGTEDQAVRKITNPFPDRSTRVDYYQLIRKWRVDLYRYGVRLTYDVTIPEPGSDVLTKILQIQGLEAAIQQGFNAPGSTLPWARFDLTPNQVRRDNYESLAAQYGVVIEPPPVESYSIVRQFTHNWPNKDSAGDSDYITFSVDVPDAYEVLAWGFSWERWAWEDEDEHFNIYPDLNSWLGRWGTLQLAAGTKWVSAFVIDLTLTVQLRASAYDAWQMRVWGTLRDAAQARYELNRTMLRNQLAQLQEELGAQDALSLRKVEREEVMKGVLRWLFGPSFTFVPPVPASLYGSNQTVINDAVWGAVLAQGEVIKFLHHAIEWENMLYFLYPYFWSHSSRWEFKKYLDHPDFMHRAFLKAGSARVVLTIRPGFEREFVSFLETGIFDGLPAGHPYLTIAEEMEAFAKTNYPGIRPANPVEGARPLLSPLQKKAWREIEGIVKLLEQFKTANGAYPTTAQGLAALGSLGTVPAADPWGTPYAYKSPGAVTDFELASLGSDGAPGGDDEAADITSWAEASLIGRWYEYTPTSALDIAFNETMPTA
jgi:hypothetical protein